LAEQKLKKIGEVTPKAFSDHLIVSLDLEWLDVYGNFCFEIFLESNGKLVLKSKRIFPKKNQQYINGI